MNKRKITILALILSILLNLFFAIYIYNKGSEKSLSKISLDKLSDSDKENVIGDLYSVEDISEDRKEEIAKNLFEEHLNKISTDWQNVKDKNLNRKPLPTFTDYRITNAHFIKESGNKFTVDITYDIQYTEEGKSWLAGYGDISDNNWILKKGNVVDVIKYKDKYLLVDVYQ
ncbi:hypothetical protein [Clostridium cibarium]|uniref:DUF4829 domain-containing protein n=1 Tax=Clostridium cibarium TaxID=2762247 RepID=A0ABR8PVS6_9CLOT|nr:hypothetical protein [Clostridium cibarium]MBD7912255.1 hypothetical protein [Clostridium cibarium]